MNCFFLFSVCIPIVLRMFLFFCYACHFNEPLYSVKVFFLIIGRSSSLTLIILIISKKTKNAIEIFVLIFILFFQKIFKLFLTFHIVCVIFISVGNQDFFAFIFLVFYFNILSITVFSLF